MQLIDHHQPIERLLYSRAFVAMVYDNLDPWQKMVMAGAFGWGINAVNFINECCHPASWQM
jgi:hypothetical protein